MSREKQRDSNHILNSSENFTPLFFFYSLKKPVYCGFPIFVVYIPFMKTYYALILLSCFFSTLAVGSLSSRPNGMDLCSKAFGGPSSHPAQTNHLLADPRLLFGENFRRGQLEGPNRYFVVDQKTFNTRKPIGRIIKKTSPTTATAEIIDPHDGTIHEMGIHLDPQNWGAFYLTSRDHALLFRGMAMQGRPDMDLVFSAVQSKKESLSDLDTPFHLQNGQVLREGLLKDNGYSSAYTRHIDGMSEGQTLKRMWINGHVNPYRTHIPYLAKPLTTYIDYIKEGVRKLSFIDLQQLVTKHGIKRSDVTHVKELAMGRMEVLEQKAEKAIKENQLTYQRFLKLIFELSQVVQYGEQVPSIKPDYIEALLEYFPLIIAIPVKGEIGIMALNESGPQGVHPLGLSYEIKTVDGVLQTPYKFTLHDFLHFKVFMHLRATSFNTVHELFHKRWIEFRESLPVEIRKNGELAYYLLTHEDGREGFIAQNPTEMNNTIINSLNNKIRQGHNFKGLKDFSQDKETKVSEVARDWIKIFENIKQELGLL